MSTAQPPFRRIAADITEQIKSGELAPGAKLPSTREIAGSYSVSMGTAYRALSLLHERDLIIGHPGRGTFVADHSGE
jgi:GntR family transcriptional regulator